MSIQLGIGTALFGMNYGISNTAGQTNIGDVENILSLSAENHISLLDTAPLYGESEHVLGQVLPTQHDFKIVTKTPGLNCLSITTKESSLIKETFYRSLENLRQDRVYSLIIHNADELLLDNSGLLVTTLRELQAEGLIQKIGVSVYTREQIHAILQWHQIDLIQLPINVFDQRLLEDDYLKKLYLMGIELHARSIFLQGILLSDLDTLPAYFQQWQNQLKLYTDTVHHWGLSKLDVAVGFIKTLNYLEHMIVGVNNVAQFEQVITSFQTQQPILLHQYEALKIEDRSLLNPSIWQTN